MNCYKRCYKGQRLTISQHIAARGTNGIYQLRLAIPNRLRQIVGRNWLYMHKAKAAKLGIEDGDWVDVASHHNTIKVQAKLVEGQNEDTVWTWNAIGKRKGTWGLTPDSPESQQGFLLNHLISDLLPEREGGYRYSNSDPITGQAAWYDLKVRVRKSADQTELSAPQFETLQKIGSA